MRRGGRRVAPRAPARSRWRRDPRRASHRRRRARAAGRGPAHRDLSVDGPVDHRRRRGRAVAGDRELDRTTGPGLAEPGRGRLARAGGATRRARDRDRGRGLDRARRRASRRERTGGNVGKGLARDAPPPARAPDPRRAALRKRRRSGRGRARDRRGAGRRGDPHGAAASRRGGGDLGRARRRRPARPRDPDRVRGRAHAPRRATRARQRGSRRGNAAALRGAY